MEDKITPKDLLEFFLFKNDLNLDENNEDLKTLASRCLLLIKQPESELLINEYFYLIKSGGFLVKYKTDLDVKTKENGKDIIDFAFRSRKHEILGDFILANEEPAFKLNTTIFWAITVSEVIRIPKDAFLEFVKEYPLIYRNFYCLTINKLISSRDYSTAIQLQSKPESSACLAAMILYIADDLGKKEGEKIDGIKRQYLMTMLSETDVDKKLNNLKELSLIDYHFEKKEYYISIIDKTGLEQITLSRN